MLLVLLLFNVGLVSFVIAVAFVDDFVICVRKYVGYITLCEPEG